MAYYDAFKTKWAAAPAGNTQSKLNWVNAAMAVGPAIPMKVPAAEIYNRTDRGEHGALQMAQQNAIQRNLAPATVDFSIGSSARALWLANFPAGSKTQTNLAPYVATFDTPQVKWWSIANQPPEIPYTRPFDMGDVTEAGLV
jgi:hypothetical protein